MSKFDVYAKVDGKIAHWHAIAESIEAARELVRHEVGANFKSAILVRIK